MSTCQRPPCTRWPRARCPAWSSCTFARSRDPKHARTCIVAAALLPCAVIFSMLWFTWSISRCVAARGGCCTSKCRSTCTQPPRGMGSARQWDCGSRRATAKDRVACVPPELRGLGALPKSPTAARGRAHLILLVVLPHHPRLLQLQLLCLDVKLGLGQGEVGPGGVHTQHTAQLCACPCVQCSAVQCSAQPTCSISACSCCCLRT